MSGRRGLITAMGAFVVLLVVTGAIAYTRFQPLTAANSSGCGPGTFGPHVVRPTYREGGTCSVGFSLLNGGQIPIRVTSIRGTGPGFLLTTTAVKLALPSAGGQTAPKDPALEPFAPFTLGRGSQRWIALINRFGGCDRYAPGTSTTWVRTEVTFEVLGIPRHQWVRLPMQVEVTSPTECPDRS